MHGNLVYTTTDPGKVLHSFYFLVMRSNRMKSTSMSSVAFLWNAIDLSDEVAEAMQQVSQSWFPGIVLLKSLD